MSGQADPELEQQVARRRAVEREILQALAHSPYQLGLEQLGKRLAVDHDLFSRALTGLLAQQLIETDGEQVVAGPSLRHLGRLGVFDPQPQR